MTRRLSERGRHPPPPGAVQRRGEGAGEEAQDVRPGAGPGRRPCSPARGSASTRGRPPPTGPAWPSGRRTGPWTHAGRGRALVALGTGQATSAGQLLQTPPVPAACGDIRIQVHRATLCFGHEHGGRLSRYAGDDMVTGEGVSVQLAHRWRTVASCFRHHRPACRRSPPRRGRDRGGCAVLGHLGRGRPHGRDPVGRCGHRRSADGGRDVTRGRTLGKLALGLRVVRDDGGPITARHALTRALVGSALDLPAGGLPAHWSPRSSARGPSASATWRPTYVVSQRASMRLLPPPVMPPPLAQWAAGADLARSPRAGHRRPTVPRSGGRAHAGFTPRACP